MLPCTSRPATGIASTFLRHVLAALVACCLMLTVFAQEANPNPPASAPPAASGTASATPAASQSPVPTMPACGSNPGQLQVVLPLESTVGKVGYNITLQWTTSASVNTGRFPAQKMSIYWQRTDVASTTWRLITDLPPKATNYNWIIPNTQDGTYKVRYVADGVDPITNTTISCVPDTFPGPAMSQGFKIINILPLDTGTAGHDNLGPNSAAYSEPISRYVAMGFVAACALGIGSVFLL